MGHYTCMGNDENNQSWQSGLLQIMLRAGDRLVQLWQQEKDLLDIQAKHDGTFVSLADYESNKVIIDWLINNCPNDSIFSEESIPDFEAIQSADRTWIIDPLDGTGSFLQGKDDFSILVALCERLRPVFGAMLFPARDKLIVGGAGVPATSNGAAIQVSRATSLRAQRIYIRNWESEDDEITSPPMDSGAALCAVAEGDLDGAIIKMTTHRDWDVGAPTAIITAAGGTVTTEAGDVVPFGNPVPPYEFFVASNGVVHDQLLALISR